MSKIVDKGEIVKIRKSTISHVSTSLKKLENKGLVEKIQSKDFSGRAKDKNLCANCDMRYYCRRKGDC